MAQATRGKLTSSTDGLGVVIAATASAGTTVHTAGAVSGTTGGDEVWIWALNTSATPVKLTIQYGGTTSPDNDIEYTVPAEAGPFLVVPGFWIQNSKVIRAFAGTTNVIVLYGYVNIITN